MNLLGLLTGKQPEPADIAIPPTPPGREMARMKYVRVLSGGDPQYRSVAACRKAWKTLQQQMAMVPGGTVELIPQMAGREAEEVQPDDERQLEVVEVASFHIDRMAVTNQEFYRFVQAGGYSDTGLWPEEIWPNVMKFVDSSGQPGPRGWRESRPPREYANHPVTGVSWYEANAFATWSGKRLPTSAQWQRAATWHDTHKGRLAGCRYPWGATFDSNKANTWASHGGGTVPVNDYRGGCTPNGVYQLIGNVWEWIDGEFAYPGIDSGQQPDWSEMRGGGFDTYLPVQASAHFRTGQPKLWREPNTGFRCVVASAELKHIPENRNCDDDND